MDTKGWGGLDTRQWWFGALVIAGPTLIAAVSTSRDNLAIIAAGVCAWAFGEWMQHPFQQFRKNGLIGDAYHRRWNVIGTILDVIGVGLVVLGVYRIWKFGGPVF